MLKIREWGLRKGKRKGDLRGGYRDGQRVGPPIHLRRPARFQNFQLSQSSASPFVHQSGRKVTKTSSISNRAPSLEKKSRHIDASGAEIP